MVSYYNPLPYSQKHSAANLAYSAGQPWQWPTNYHTPPNHQFLGDMDSPHSHHQMYYNPMFHTPAVSATSDWHSPASSGDNFSPPQNISNAHHLFHHQHHTPGGVLAGSSSAVHPSGSGSGIGNNLSSANGSESVAVTNGSGHTTLNENTNNINDNQIAEGLPSPPITVSGSEISSPGAPASSASPHHMASHHLQSNGNNNNNNSPITAHSNAINNHLSHNPNHRQASPVKSPFYDWMKKPSYPAQPTPGKTRTKDKYRVVYTDFQRLELEKEYCTSRYITIRRKTELAQTLSLSERQVKIWFQNRRAKERKQSKKGSESSLGMQQHNDYASLMDTKPKLEPGLQHLQHSLHSMTSMAAMSMPAAIGLHHHHHLHGHHHHHHALAAHSAATHHPSLHQPPHSQISAAAVAAAVSVGSLSM